MKIEINSSLKKCDWFDIYFEESSSTPIVFKNNRFYSVSEKNSSGFGVRVNKSGKTGFSFCSSPEMIEAASINAIQLSAFGEEDSFKLPDKAKSFPEQQFENFDKNHVMEKAQEQIERLHREFPDSLTDIHITSGKGSRKIINSSGLDFNDQYEFFSASISTTRVSRDGVRTDIGESSAKIKSFDLSSLTDKIIRYHHLAEKIIKVDAGKIPVIFTPSAFSSLLSILLSQMNAVNHFKKISPFTEKLGTKVFSDHISISDDPTIPDSVYSLDYDDEGFHTFKKNIVEKGVLGSVISDLRYSKLLGISPTGNATRSFSSMPYPSFTNIVVSAGNNSLKEIMKQTGKGILVDEMLGLGQSNTITGDFSCNLNMAFQYENGEITGRVKDCMISDNFYSLLASDILLSAETETNGNVIAPYLFCPKINFSL